MGEGLFMIRMTLSELAQQLGGTYVGDAALLIEGLSSIDDIQPNTLVFAEGPENLQKAEVSVARVILVGEGVVSEKKAFIQVAEPFQAFKALIQQYYAPRKPLPSLHPTAVIGENVHLGAGVFIGPYVTIEADCVIGDGCVLKNHVSIGRGVVLGEDTMIYPHVTIYDHCLIGSRVIIHAGTVIGSDGFGYTFQNGAHVKTPHAGAVKLQDDVEIGANSVVDRATLGYTVVGEGTKIDNLVQVAHGVRLGKHNVLCAFTGIAGSSTTEDYVIFAANVGVSDHVYIEEGVVLAARAGVPPRKVLKKGNVYLGNPARPKEKAIELELGALRIPLMRKNLKALSERMEQIERKLGDGE